MDLRQVAAALGGDVSKDQVLAPGPGHSPADRSLSVKLSTDAPDGFIVHSFAGDDPIICRDYVREKCGWPAFKPNGNGRQRPSSAEIEKLLASAIEYQQPKVAAKYRYVSQDGKTTLYEVVKYDPKGFAQRRPDGKGGWIWNLDGQKRVIYRWPYIAENPGTVFITEGEKDADRVIEQLGYAATTVASGKWTEDCVEALRNRDCWILEDNDDKGARRHATPRKIFSAPPLVSELYAYPTLASAAIFPIGSMPDTAPKNSRAFAIARRNGPPTLRTQASKKTNQRPPLGLQKPSHRRRLRLGPIMARARQLLRRGLSRIYCRRPAPR
jgi:hypothetical protein